MNLNLREKKKSTSKINSREIQKVCSIAKFSLRENLSQQNFLMPVFKFLDNPPTHLLIKFRFFYSIPALIPLPSPRIRQCMLVLNSRFSYVFAVAFGNYLGFTEKKSADGKSADALLFPLFFSTNQRRTLLGVALFFSRVIEKKLEKELFWGWHFFWVWHFFGRCTLPRSLRTINQLFSIVPQFSLETEYFKILMGWGVGVVLPEVFGCRVLCFLFSHTEFDLRTNFRWKPSIS